MWLFRCLRAKDVFEAFFRKDLAKRLLLGRAASDDAERSVLASLKAECGPSYTSKLEGMLRDVAACRALEADFAEAAPPRGEWAEGEGVVAGGLEFAVQALTTTHWPSYKSWVPTLPRPLLRPMEVFQEWYRSKHSGRRLVWQHSLGTCTVVGHFRAGRREFVLSELQAALLLLFNGQESFTFAELRSGVGGSGTSTSSTSSSSSSSSAAGGAAPGGAARAAAAAEAGPSDPEVTRSVLSLCVGKHKVLQRTRAGQTDPAAAAAAAAQSKPNPRAEAALAGRVKDEDEFSFNASFRSKQLRIRVNQLQLRESREERSATSQRVAEARQFQMDAALVRIMKARKSLRHEQLVAECVAQLRCPARPADIKRRIESLIDRDYLERDDSDSSLYLYVA